MKIYYTHNFTGGREESHKLLERVVGSIDGLRTGLAGKPYLPNGPEFSISHSANTWAVIKGEEACGLDVQYVRDCDEMKLAERWFHSDEVAYLKACSDLVGEFFRIWTRREALVKALGNSIVTSSLPSTLADEIEYEAGIWQIRDVEIPGLNAGKVCEERPAYAAVCAKRIDKLEFISMDELK